MPDWAILDEDAPAPPLHRRILSSVPNLFSRTTSTATIVHNNNNNGSIKTSSSSSFAVVQPSSSATISVRTTAISTPAATVTGTQAATSSASTPALSLTTQQALAALQNTPEFQVRCDVYVNWRKFPFRNAGNPLVCNIVHCFARLGNRRRKQKHWRLRINSNSNNQRERKTA